MITSGYASSAWDGARASRAALVSGLAQRWSQLRGLGIPVAAVADSPLSPNDLDVCTARAPHRLSTCAFDRAPAVAGSGQPEQRLAAAQSGTPLIDLTPWICPVDRCPVAIGHVTVHRSGDHLTATYVRTLAAVLGEALDRAHLGQRAPLR
ncbi:hypothetical protein GKE56_08110 [Nostocoides sp. HKS02]|nr:hypothetical protein GKE56_08110 [Tetrasphaera sp. HKS02]